MSLLLSGSVAARHPIGPWSDPSRDRVTEDTSLECPDKVTSRSGVFTAGLRDCCGQTHIGRVRDRNEDQFLIADLMKSVVVHHTSLSYEQETELHGVSQGKLFLVADGVGGTPGGERASSIAVKSIVQYLQDMMHWLFRREAAREDQFLEDLKSAVAWSQEQIRHTAEKSPRYARMGTTLTVAYLVWPTAYLVHVGDSRAYLCRGSKLLQLTRDQSIAQLLADAGAIAADEVEHHHFRHVLGSVLSRNSSDLHPAVCKARLMEGDQLLLCTDGLTKHVNPLQIAGILASASTAEQACHDLIAAANAAGGTDNITVVLARG
ncbi:MAG: serine/threonine-protein phosphatase [Planctomycetes bacterium]|nr:serine/threonine-protein phosphatase [Planctomycetota bacterium]